ncbi:response regulator [Candidatus Pacearchaeota archaeon]|nr:response regulator [Candidatus Pacearchaeota archaeon]|tara:strand:- start:1051 stop:1419 length:369 start_codon:yes stop_codon:yes gene_type:complete
MEELNKKVILVGNCDYDGPQIKSFIENNFNADVEDIKTMDGGIAKLDNVDLVLVNRVGRDQRNGLELIDYIKNKNVLIPVMLITNYKDKMDEAMEHGAVEGFGKEDLFNDSERVKQVLSEYL